MTATILAFDTSGPHCAVSLLMNGAIVSERFEAMAKGQAERLFPLIEEVMAETGAVWEEIDAIAVGTGPGNFTGIRIAVSAARGLALSLNIPAIGVSGFAALRGSRLFSDAGPMIVSLPSTRRGADVMLQFFQNGAPMGDPVELAIFGQGTIDPSFQGFPDCAPVLGFEAAAVDFALQNDEGGATYLEFGETYSLTAQIAHVAALEIARGDDFPRPSPVYIRPPDAAPPSDPAPVILP